MVPSCKFCCLAYLIETLFYNLHREKDFMDNAENTTRCFYQCLNLKNLDTIWTEFGTFAYNIHSFCSRNLKHSSDTLSMER